MISRKGEAQKSWARSHRFYNVDTYTFFTTREGIDHGPFVSLSHAERALERYVRMVMESKQRAESNATIPTRKT